MRLCLTVLATPPCDLHERAGPCLHDLDVDAPADSTCADLGRALAGHLDRPGPMLAADGATVPDDLRVGTPPVVDGSVLRWGHPRHSAVHPAVHPAVHSPGPAPIAPMPTNPVQLWVRHGPDSGRMIDLTPESLTIGRSALASVTLHDASLSRVHLEVRRDALGVTVRDLTSTNGTSVDGVALTAAGERLDGGSVLRVGDSELMLGVAAGPPAVLARADDGTLVPNRMPRTTTEREPPLIAFPDRPPAVQARRVAWTQLAAPLVAAAVMAAFFGPSMLAFALVGPLMAALSTWSDRRRGRRDHAEQLAQWAHRHAEALATLDRELALERATRRDASPDPAVLLGIASGPGARLWERRRDAPDWLGVAIGTCTCDSTIGVAGPLPDRVSTPPPQVVGSPCVLPLAAIGVLGIAGPRERVAGVVRGLLGQLVTLHSPADLAVVVLGADGRADDWSWLSLVPHCRPGRGGDEHPVAAGILDRDPRLTSAVVEGLARQLRLRRADRGVPGKGWSGPATVALLDGAAALRQLPGLAELLAGGAEVGLTFIALETETSALPVEAEAVLDLTNRRPTLNYPGHRHEDLLVDQVGGWWTERLSRALAPLTDAASARAGPQVLPQEVGLLEILPGSDTAEGVEDLWRDRVPGATFPVGASARGPWKLDLVADGPHVLVAGTTGSGKSELLRTVVVSLAAHHPPEDVAFILVDYKGGAAFRRCTALPHVLATITDLDDELAQRSLTWLRAEVRRREMQLARSMADDFDSVEQSSEMDRTMPRLFVIIDEFRALAHDLPAFIDGVVDLAARGRSLGIHVVLATQRPAGVVTADVKANLSLRIALRVRDGVDSLDVVDGTDAAAIDPATPGRAFVRTAAAELLAVQAAHSRARSGPRALRVRERTWGSSPLPWPDDGLPEVATDLDRIVEAVVEAAARRNVVPGVPRWLSPLPVGLTHAELPEPTGPARCVVGVVDRPHRQDQVPLELALDEPGHWTLVGAARSGRTTGLRAIAGAATSRFPPERLHVYAISSGSLSPLATLPHCGAHVDADDIGRIERLVSILSEEVRRRRRHGAGRPSAHLLLLIDDWDQIAAAQRPTEYAAVVHRLLGLLRDGESHGVTAIIAGGRGLLVGSGVPSRRRLLLRLTDPGDAALAGAPTTLKLDQWPPGRAWLSDGTVVQLATGDPRAPVPRVSDADAAPRRVDPLPWPVRARAMPVHHTHGAGTIVLGVGGDDLAPLALDETTDGSRWLVAGPPRSGVSCALLLLARHLVGAGRRIIVVSGRPGPLDALRSDPRVTWHTPQDGVGARAPTLGAASSALVVDRADELARSPAEGTLRNTADQLVAAGGLVIIGGSVTALSGQHGGLGADAARTRTGVLLGPAAPSDGLLFGVRVRADPDAPPGRGHLVRQGQAVPIQLALPDELHGEVR